MKQRTGKSLVAAGLALLALIAAGLVIRKEMYDYSPDRLYDRAKEAHGVVIRKPSKPRPAPETPGPAGKQPPAHKTPARPASQERSALPVH